MSEAFRCSECGVTFDSLSKYAVHRKWKHPKAGDPKVKVVGKPVDRGLKALTMLEEGSTPVEVMTTLSIPAQDMIAMLREYREIKMLTEPPTPAATLMYILQHFFQFSSRDSLMRQPPSWEG